MGAGGRTLGVAQAPEDRRRRLAPGCLRQRRVRLDLIEAALEEGLHGRQHSPQCRCGSSGAQLAVR